jgi:hypothetical protein
MIYPLDSSADYKVILTYLGLFTEDEFRKEEAEFNNFMK